MSSYPRLSDSDLAIVGRVRWEERSIDILEVTDGEAFAVAQATAAIRLRIDIARADKPMFLALSPPWRSTSSACCAKAERSDENIHLT